MASRFAWLALALCGCRSLLGIEDPTSIDSDAGTEPDSPLIDSLDLVDARQCYGSGLVAICLTTPPTMPRTLSSTIDTGIDSNCDQIATTNGTTACVIAGTTVNVPAGTVVRATGPRPLVIVATDMITIAGSLSVSSLRGAGSGAGAPGAACASTMVGESDTGGGGGGAGGSFAGRGGNGGTGDLNDKRRTGR